MTQRDSQDFHINLGREPKLELNFEVRHVLRLKEALVWGFVCMSFTGAVVEVLGDGIALPLG